MIKVFDKELKKILIKQVHDSLQVKSVDACHNHLIIKRPFHVEMHRTNQYNSDKKL
jgi:hypothetical protein